MKTSIQPVTKKSPTGAMKGKYDPPILESEKKTPEYYDVLCIQFDTTQDWQHNDEHHDNEEAHNNSSESCESPISEEEKDSASVGTKHPAPQNNKKGQADDDAKESQHENVID